MTKFDDPDVAALRFALDARNQQVAASRRFTAEAITELLTADVLHQDAAVATIAAPLAIALSGLRLRSRGPAASFVFVGPTGCGKTKLARSLRRLSNCGDRVVIQLDMGEYTDATSVNRLIGANRGYVGFNDTASLLTTRVAAAPDAVVILDEFEKAHETLQRVLLQMFEEGTLTDGRGCVAQFDRAIVVLTTNLGASDLRHPIGFRPGSACHAGRSSEIDASVRTALLPELVGRIDAIVPFSQLDEAARTAIARQMIDDWCTATRATGWDLCVADEIAGWLVRTSDPRYGARPLRRAIEDRLALGLVGRPRGAWRAALSDAAIRWTDADA